MHRELLEQIDTEIVTEGTVFQTAILVMFIVPGRSLGIKNKKKAAVWKTVPTQTEFTCSSLRDDHKCSKSITDKADATDFIFFTDFI